MAKKKQSQTKGIVITKTGMITVLGRREPPVTCSGRKEFVRITFSEDSVMSLEVVEESDTGLIAGVAVSLTNGVEYAFEPDTYDCDAIADVLSKLIDL